ncbi:TspO/MBR family protein [Liquorilactobacillus nagelii]|uniref:TspO/MBR family protein n=1 Tax=Liquorilactobacillus nagelii TaxID=82688 RepID=UPI0039EB40F6
MNNSIKFNWIHLFIFIIVIELIGSLSAVFAGDIKTIYSHLSLPVLSPPTYLFGIVWPILYALIGIAGYLIYYTPSIQHDKVINYVLFGSQLVINFIWSIIFFKYEAYWLSFAVIIVLDLIVLLCIINFFKSSQLASILFVPYFVWIIFASYLTIGVAILN